MPTQLQTKASPAAQGYVREDVLVDLAQVLAHRIRGLVASIEGFADLLADTLYTRDQRELALRILEGSSRIESVLADLQRYGEPVDPVPLPLYPPDVTHALLDPLAEEDRARVTVDVALRDEEAPLLDADPFLLRQALLVLVQNALEATRRGGGVRVHIHDTAAGIVRFDVWNDGCIDVEDAGRRVFEPFYTSKAHNLGVGLPMARRIARAHGGRLELTQNDPSAGTCFTLTLPRARGEAFT